MVNLVDIKKFFIDYNYYLFLALCIITIIFLVSAIIFNMLYVNSDQSVTNNSVFASLIVALISAIGVAYNYKFTNESMRLNNDIFEENKKHNKKSINQNNKLFEENKKYNEKVLKQNSDSLYIQLRFKGAEDALYTLMNELQLTLLIYEDLVKLGFDNLLFNPRGFLMLQYVNLISDVELLKYIPLKLRSEFQYSFLSRREPNLIKESYDYIDILNNCNDNIYKNEISVIITCYEFIQCVNKFNDNCVSNYFKMVFCAYYSSNISAEEMRRFMIWIINLIVNSDLEDHILDERILEIKTDYEKYFS